MRFNEIEPRRVGHYRHDMGQEQSRQALEEYIQREHERMAQPYEPVEPEAVEPLPLLVMPWWIRGTKCFKWEVK